MIPRLSIVFNRFFDWLMPSEARSDPDLVRRAKRVALLDVVFFFWALVFAGVYVAAGSLRCGLVTLSYPLWSIGSLYAVKRGRSVAWSASLLCCGGCVTLAGDALFSGGSLSPPLLWLSCAPVVAAMTAGMVWGAAWLGLALAIVAVFIAAEAGGISFANDLAPFQFKSLYYAVLIGLIACQFIMVWVRVVIERRVFEALRLSKRRLAEACKLLDTLQSGFGISTEEWSKLKREKAALEYAMRSKVGFDEPGLADADVEDELELDEAEVAHEPG